VLGYATTLNIGVIMTLFTAVFMAHVMFDWWLKRGKDIKFTTRISHNNFANLNIQFVAKRKYAYIISGTLAVIGLVSIVVKGFDYGVDFSGGHSYVVQFNQDIQTEEVASELNKVFGLPPQVKTYGTNDKVKITTGYMIDQSSTKADSMVNYTLYTGLKKFIGENTSYQTYLQKNQLSSQVVGPSISADILSSAYKAIFFSLLGIFLYICSGSGNGNLQLGAIIALTHDVLMVMGAYSLLFRHHAFHAGS
jgi:SecD/SecF fusion protein